ncbi:tetratricopeptide repeat protein [Bradyrhizobium sp. AUGA SZCCT0431]|uniref:tetratricopeptide repeat protein n=1 Tax=Bradyrhizobium sp. AUGA SZCCT0431 TaxID=2807674 RepID=UPI001BAD3147|nr:hypothetical protein [Bradyrhizobium sp. AUGA SZCCT0431]MBR1145209.1 hypothetical protein [Bradyrhizobium sp. AUGA SZCCT0431]
MSIVFSDLRSKIGSRLSGFSGPARLAIIAISVVIVAIVLLWLFNQLFYYLLAKSYAEELSQAYNLNKGFTKALVWASFAAIVLFAGCTFSFSKHKRNFGYVGILGLLIGHSVLLGMRDANYDGDGKTQKCYVLTRDGIKILNHVGVDPDTGRECKLLTPQMTEKYNAYRNGKRPLIVTDTNPAFFDPVSGEPIIWFAKTDAGRVELFDLMGFHPQTGEELKPVDKPSVDEWRRQSSKVVRRMPNRVPDPDKYGFFDALSGNPKVWFWVSEASEYEFFDGPGFHPTSGDEFKVITREKIAAWRQSVEVAAQRKKKEQEQQAQEARDRQAQELAAKQAAQDAKNIAERQATEELQKQQQAGLDCDRLAANPTDIRRKAEGATFDVLRGHADQAIEVCSKAVQQSPSELRYQYQLGRAYQFKDRRKAFDIFVTLVRAEYPAAFDNLGGMYLGKDNEKAVQLFLRGRDLDDADSMVSLGDMIDKGTYPTDNPLAMKLALLKRAADLGHAGAQRAFPLELAKAQQAQSNQETQRQMLEIFGQIVAGAIRR